MKTIKELTIVVVTAVVMFVASYALGHFIPALY